MNPYTKRKFLNLPLAGQHKKSAELLKLLYLNPIQEDAAYYNELQEWMHLPHLADLSPKTMSDRYHQHLQQAGIHLTEPSLLPRVRTGDRAHPIAKRLDVHLYLDHIRSAHNVGSILRTVEAFGLGDVYFSADTPLPTHPQVIKTAMGCACDISYHRQALPEQLPGPLIALETGPKAVSIDAYTFPPSCCLAVGNEEYGLSDELLDRADVIVEIPLYGKKNSLNVANAFAIAAAIISQQIRNQGKPCISLK